MYSRVSRIQTITCFKLKTLLLFHKDSSLLRDAFSEFCCLRTTTLSKNLNEFIRILFGKIYLNHRGFISDRNFENIRKQCPILLQNWSKIQTRSSLMVGKAHKKYYKDFRTYQKARSGSLTNPSNPNLQSPNRTLIKNSSTFLVFNTSLVHWIEYTFMCIEWFK